MISFYQLGHGDQAEGKGAYLLRCRILQRCRNLQLLAPSAT